MDRNYCFRRKRHFYAVCDDAALAASFFLIIVLLLSSVFDRLMSQKLFALANDKCAIETPDNPMLQEVLLGGHLYQIILKVSKYFFKSK